MNLKREQSGSNCCGPQRPLELFTEPLVVRDPVPNSVSKLGIVEEEADETIFWMELLVDSNIVRPPLMAELLKEANEIVAIVVSSINTSRRTK